MSRALRVSSAIVAVLVGLGFWQLASAGWIHGKALLAHVDAVIRLALGPAEKSALGGIAGGFAGGGGECRNGEKEK